MTRSAAILACIFCLPPTPDSHELEQLLVDPQMGQGTIVNDAEANLMAENVRLKDQIRTLKRHVNQLQKRIRLMEEREDDA